MWSKAFGAGTKRHHSSEVAMPVNPHKDIHNKNRTKRVYAHDLK